MTRKEARTIVKTKTRKQERKNKNEEGDEEPYSHSFLTLGKYTIDKVC